MAEQSKEERIDISKIDNFDDFMTLSQPVGSIERAHSNNLYGVNHLQVKGVLENTKDSYGLTFFTRPQLNMTTSNLRHLRNFYNLLTDKAESMQRYVRCVLDPRLAAGGNTDTKISTPLVDEHLGFIAMLTNNLKTISGWPDVIVPTYTSTSGMRKEQWSIVDGITEINESFDIDATFRNVKGSPIILLMQTWLLYMASVFEGLLSPYIDYIWRNTIDYNTRIYRLVLDSSKRYVTMVASTGASFPVNVPTGKLFDFTDENKYNDQTKEINIRFKCMGAIYNDPITIKEFNEVSAIFNSDVRNMLNGKPHNLEQIPYNLIDKLNHRGYPIIDYNTYELKWYISKSSKSYTNLIKLLKEQ